MNRLARRVHDRRVLRLIGRYLHAGVFLPDGKREPTTCGVPQGGPLSPLLANIMLDDLDKELEARGLRFARYADDFLIFVRSRSAAHRVLRVMIPKASGGQRPLGIPTVLDRVIQQAIAQVLGPLFEPQFSEHSYGFRPKRSARMALSEMEQAHGDGLRFAVDCDLKSFFDTVNHGLMMNRLARKVNDPRVLRLISRYLHAGVILPDGSREPTSCGVPQGGPLSPLLAQYHAR